MSGEFRGWKQAGTAVIACVLTATVWLAAHAVGTGDVREAEVLLEEQPRSSRSTSRELSWSFAIDRREPAPARHGVEVVDLYDGPRVSVRIEVIDAFGRVVPGAEVEVLARRDEYELTNQVPVDDGHWDRVQHPMTMPTDESDTDWVVVQRGRTDGEGVWSGRLQPEVEVVFHARNGDREGLSPLFYGLTDGTPEELEEQEALRGLLPGERLDHEVQIEILAPAVPA